MSQIKTKYIADNQITNIKLSQVSSQTFKGRTSASTGNVEDLTATQATAILNSVVGDSGSGGVKGLVPAPGSGDAAANKFLKADGTFSVLPSYLPAWTKYTVSHTTFQTAATTNNATLFTLPVKGFIHQVIIKHSVAFAGTSITAYTISVGNAGNLTKYATNFDVFQSVSDTARSITQSEDVESFTGTTAIKIQATSTGANLSASTAGSVDVWVLSSTLP